MQPLPRLEVRGITKRFPGVQALSQVSLCVQPGEVLAVIGENGAGKSTLMKILVGIVQPDAGEIRLEGRPIIIDGIQAAMQAGIALMHQELNLCDNLDAAANIYLGREEARLGFIPRGRLYKQAGEFLKRVGAEFDPRHPVARLSIAERQLVEIAKALSMHARVLIMDEPTSSLSQREADNLFRVVRDLRQEGVSIIYISHRLGEVKLLADQVTALRDGQNAGTLSKEEITHERMVRLMVGRDVSKFYDRKPHQPAETRLEVRGLVTTTYPKHRVSFAVRSGEIVGIGGLVGAGRTELLRAIFGIDKPLAGTILVDGQPADIRNPHTAIEHGLGLVPEDRKLQGLILEFGVRHNIGLAGLTRFALKKLFLNFQKERQDTAEMVKRLAIKLSDEHRPVQLLSGGNQQKVVLGKWLALAPRVLLLDEPTRGIDIGAKEEIYHLLDKLAAAGMAILFVSSEMEEILGLADRVLVMHEGALSGELARDQLSEEAVMWLATGLSKRQPEIGPAATVGSP